MMTREWIESKLKKCNPEGARYNKKKGIGDNAINSIHIGDIEIYQ